MLPGVIVFLNGAFGVGKTSTARALHDALRRDYKQPLIVPMTVWRVDVWRHLRDGFHEADSELRAFRLTASEETLRARILGRPDDEGPHGWCLRHMPVAMAALRKEEYGTEIRTDERTPDEIAAVIPGTL